MYLDCVKTELFIRIALIADSGYAEHFLSQLGASGSKETFVMTCKGL